jgi:hypothetical protein
LFSLATAFGFELFELFIKPSALEGINLIMKNESGDAEVVRRRNLSVRRARSPSPPSPKTRTTFRSPCPIYRTPTGGG